ncbi:hypothetical protein BDQ94DRAFT_132312 [Aspergillus welwitschiae]|uniref:Uncharacterized protein n=1 Tax=Aspergillus welwitschiae TaxID=1341132 RepID=A0A3F3QIH0_9EURO|nr:hypothetical protein BDQ94DRAFT_132312 [Aspergillus welwitschiae]RDH39078.1 hypothetical protein BDQ94DRAFT_132312 [Aspergillus welwitschiae]
MSGKEMRSRRIRCCIGFWAATAGLGRELASAGHKDETITYYSRLGTVSMVPCSPPTSTGPWLGSNCGQGRRREQDQGR